MTELRLSFGEPFAEQMAALRLRLGNRVETARWDDLWQAMHDRAFMVAGAAKGELLADLAKAVETAIGEHRSLEAFRAEFRAIVQKHGWHGWTGEGTAKGEAWRTKVIYRTNMATSYAAGRMAQLVKGNFAFWVYRHGNAREPRLQHLAWDGLALPPDHPFWATHAPPNGWGCTCVMYGANSPAGIRRVGGDPDKVLPEGWQARDAKTGAPPGIDKGWDYPVGRGVAQDILSQLDRKLPILPARIGSDLAEAAPRMVAEERERLFPDFVDEVLAGPPRGRHMIVGAMKPAWVKAAETLGVLPESAEFAVRDRDVWHALRDAKHRPVEVEWYKQLPQHLLAPDAILLDTTDAAGPALVMVFLSNTGDAKIVVRVNFTHKTKYDDEGKKHREKQDRVFNLVRTAALVSANDLRSLIGRGFAVIAGAL